MGAATTPSALDESSIEAELVVAPPAAQHRADRIARAFLMAIGLAFVLAVIGGAGLGAESEGGARLGGDYPAFHTAGSIVLDGDIDLLYDARRQALEQNDLGIDGYLAFAYPPHVAFVYAPLAALGFRAGYAVHTMLMMVALVAAIRLMPVPALAGRVWPATALAVGFWPLFRAVGGGQNTAITLLVFAAVWRLLDEDRELAAGLAAAALLYRPQYALPLIGVMALDRRWRAVTAATVAGMATWLTTAAILGVGWSTTWLDQVLPFVERDAEVNSANSISLLGFAQAVLGPDDRLAIALGATSAIAVAAFLAWIWSRGDRVSLELRMGCLAAGVLLCSPHTMFYDAGLLVVSAGALLAAAPIERRSLVLGAIGMVWVLGFAQLASSALGASPLALVVAGVFLAGAVIATNGSTTQSPRLRHA